MGRPRARLQDIADATGFSMNTVSLALRGSPRIGGATRKLILQEAAKQNYFPNRIARSLVSKASNTIGLIMTDITNPTLTLAAQTIERKLSAAGYGIMFAASDSHAENERRALQWFQSFQVDGILLYPADHGDVTHAMAVDAAGIPVILLATIPSSGLDFVTVDDRIGGRRAIEHLLSRGHRRIVMVHGGREIHSTEKIRGARDAIRKAGLPKDALSLVHPQSNSAAAGYAAAQEARVRHPDATAIFASTDRVAIGALRWCQANGIGVPDKMAVMGYDGTEAAEYCSPPLSTVRYASDEVSSIAVDRMIDLIENGASRETAFHKRIEPELVVRSTT